MVPERRINLGGATAVLGAAVVATAVAGSAAWGAWRAWDRRRLAADPEAAVLFSELKGEPLAVTSRDGTRIHAEVFGTNNRRTIVLVHGWTCSLRFWVNQVRALSEDHRVVAFDLRGHGRSDHGHTPTFTTDALAEDLEAVLEASLRPQEKATLVGHSLGAMTIVAWSGKYRESVARRASGVVMTNTGIGDLVSETLLIRTPERLNRVRQPIARLLLSASTPIPRVRTPISAAAVRYIALSPGASHAQVAFCERMVMECDPGVRGGFGRSLSELDLYETLQHLKLPTTVIAGAADRLTPPSHADRLADQLPHLVANITIPAVGHMGPVEAPGPTTAAIRDMVGRTD